VRELPREPEPEPEAREPPAASPGEEPPRAADRSADEPVERARDADAADIIATDDEPSDDDAVVSAQSERLPSATELYEEGRASAAALIERRALEEDHYRFSTDLFEEPVAEAPNPREDMFEPGAGGKGSRSFMQPGQGRTRLGRWLADTCNALTGGGIGLAFNGLTFGSLCAEDRARSDLFADIKPDYLKSLPVCEEVPLEAPAPDGGGLSAIKCRLVLQE
jgi:hypothetical protein